MSLLLFGLGRFLVACSVHRGNALSGELNGPGCDT